MFRNLVFIRSACGSGSQFGSKIVAYFDQLSGANIVEKKVKTAEKVVGPAFGCAHYPKAGPNTQQAQSILFFKLKILFTKARSIFFSLYETFLVDSSYFS